MEEWRRQSPHDEAASWEYHPWNGCREAGQEVGNSITPGGSLVSLINYPKIRQRARCPLPKYLVGPIPHSILLLSYHPFHLVAEYNRSSGHNTLGTSKTRLTLPRDKEYSLISKLQHFKL